jgi:hypothetical protein
LQPDGYLITATEALARAPLERDAAIGGGQDAGFGAAEREIVAQDQPGRAGRRVRDVDHLGGKNRVATHWPPIKVRLILRANIRATAINRPGAIGVGCGPGQTRGAEVGIEPT